jgi:hypothetical protein
MYVHPFANHDALKVESSDGRMVRALDGPILVRPQKGK